MKIKKTGKLLVLLAASTALVATLINDKKNQSDAKDKESEEI